MYKCNIYTCALKHFDYLNVIYLFYLSGIPVVVVSLVLAINKDAYGVVSVVEDTIQSEMFGAL